MSEYPFSLPAFPEKSTVRDTPFSPEKFWNGKDANQVYDEVRAIAKNLGVFEKLEAIAGTTSVLVPSGTAAFLDKRVDFSGGVVLLSGTSAVWLNEDGSLQAGATFPSKPHAPIGRAIFSGTEIAAYEDKRIFINALIRPTASGIAYTAEPGVWDAPVPSGVDEALDQLADRVRVLEGATPVPSGLEIPIFPRYPWSVEVPDPSVAFSHGRETTGARRHFYEIRTVASGIEGGLISLKHQLPKLTKLSSVKIEVYRSGTPVEIKASLFGPTGVPDPGLAGTSLLPLAAETFVEKELFVSGTYGSHEILTLELEGRVSFTDQAVRFGRIKLKGTP